MTEVSIEFPAHLPSSAVMSASARSVCSLPTVSDREDAVPILFKLIDSVLAAPADVKKRRVKKSNETFHRKVGRHEGAVQFLKAAGFVDSDDPDAGAEGRGAMLSMPVAYIVRLTDAHHSLASAAEQAGLTAPPLPACPVFNPYAASSTAVDSTRTAKVPQSYKIEAERIQTEIREKEAALKRKVETSPPIPLNATAFWSAAGRRLEEVVKETASTADEEKGDSAIVGGQISGVKSAINGSNLKFESADRKKLTKLEGKVVHEFCILRVTCPDKSVLQVHFRAADKCELVLSEVKPLLAPHIQAASWFIYQSPPLKKLNGKERLDKAGFAPGANLYLGFDEKPGEKPGPPYLEASLQASLGPQPQDQGRGVNAIAGHLSGEAMGWGQGQKVGQGAPGAAAALARQEAANATALPEGAAPSPGAAAPGAAAYSTAPVAPAGEAAPAAGAGWGQGQRLGGPLPAEPAQAPMDVDATGRAAA